MWKKVSIFSVTLFLVGSVLTHPATGKEYPTRPIEIYCPYSPGGPADLTSRLVADMASKFLGQPMVVVSKTGASGSIAAAELINSKPDGYKLITLTNTFFSTTVKTQQIPFNPNDITPLASFAEDRLGIAVRRDSSWKTIDDLLDYGRKNPSKIRWGHTGRGNIQHIMTLLVFKKAGVETIDVPYKGVPEMLAALLGGHLEALSAPYATLQEHVKVKKVSYLLVHSSQRYSVLPEVPCAAEAGFPEVANLAIYWGLHAHRNTPEEIKKTLFNAFKKTHEDPGFKKGVENAGLEPRFGGPEFIKEAIKKAEDIGVPVLKELGFYIEQK